VDPQASDSEDLGGTKRLRDSRSIVNPHSNCRSSTNDRPKSLVEIDSRGLIKLAPKGSPVKVLLSECKLVFPLRLTTSTHTFRVLIRASTINTQRSAEALAPGLRLLEGMILWGIITTGVTHPFQTLIHWISRCFLVKLDSMILTQHAGAMDMAPT